MLITAIINISITKLLINISFWHSNQIKEFVFLSVFEILDRLIFFKHIGWNIIRKYLKFIMIVRQSYFLIFV